MILMFWHEVNLALVPYFFQNEIAKTGTILNKKLISRGIIPLSNPDLNLNF